MPESSETSRESAASAEELERIKLERIRAARALAAQRSSRAETSQPPAERVEILSDAELERPLPKDDLDDRPLVIPGYELTREISRGGQAAVFEATQAATGRRVAVKVLRGGPYISDRERARFEREVQFLAALSHPNIVRVIDRGRTPDGSLYLAMDLIDGPTLEQHIQSHADAGGRRDDAGALELFIKICRAVDEANKLGIIHRDLKPSNVRVDARGEPHVLDFGLARLGQPMIDDPTVTTTGQFVGSLPYASPEQVDGRPTLDGRSDVYSLGVMLYQALAGKFPYDVSGTPREVLDHVLTATPAPLRRHADRKLEAIVLRALQKKPEQRYGSAGELADDLRRYLEGKPTVARPQPRWRRPVALATIGLVLVGLAWGATHLPVASPELRDATWAAFRNDPHGAPEDGEIYDGHTYKVFTEAMTWHEARERAERMGGHLAVINDAAEAQLVAELINPAAIGRPAAEMFWLGIESDGQEFRSVDDTPVNHRPLRPSPEFQGMRPLGVVAYTWSRQDYARPCGMVVEWDSVRPRGGRAAAEPPRDAVEFQGHRYKLITDAASWPEARAAARRLGAELVGVDSDAEQAFLASLAKQHGVERFWIGARLFDERLVWCDDAARSFDGRAPGPQAGKNEVLYWTADGWHSMPVSDPPPTLPYVCEWSE